MSEKWIYFFGDGSAEGRGDEKELLGGKGAGLAEMSGLGIPIVADVTNCRGHGPTVSESDCLVV